MNENKKEYLAAELHLVKFDTSDVIATSGSGFNYIDPDDNSWV